MRGLLLSLAAVVACIALAAPVDAQYPPPPPGDPQAARCAQTGVRGRNGNFRPTNEFSPGQRGLTRGRNNCARDKVRVKASLDTEAQVIGLGRSDDQGAYRFGIRIPETASIGPHTFIIRTRGRRYEKTIEVVGEDGAAGAGFNSTAGPMLIAWVALGGLVAAFFVGSRRRRRMVAAVATAQHDVPLLDTSGFIPVRPRRRRASRTPTDAVSGKPKTVRKNARRKAPGASEIAKPPAPRKQPAKAKPAANSKPVAKAERAGATTQRRGSKAPDQRAGNAKPNQRRKQAGKGPQA